MSDYIERDVTLVVTGKTAKFNDKVYIFKGDKDIQLNIEIIDTKMKYSRTNPSGNVLLPLPSNCYAKVGLLKPKGEQIIRERVPIVDNKVAFVIDESICDELEEIGIHKIQIQIWATNEETSPRWTLPSAAELEVLKPDVDFQENQSNVSVAKVGEAKTNVKALSTQRPTLNDEGLYNKKEWIDNEVITKEDLNTIEEGIYKNSSSLNNIANEIGVDEQNNFVELNTTDKTIIGAINEVFQSASNGKSLIANAITGKGIATSSDSTFQTMATNISNINNIDNAVVKIKGITYRLNKVNDEIIATKIAGMEDLLEGRILLWSDDFEGTEVDLNTWTFDDRDKYNALVNSWTGGAVTTVSDSILNIKAVKQKHGSYSAEWSSDQLWTRKKYANSNCRWECKMKFDVMNGCWPAFWLMGDNFTGTGPEAGQGGLGWPSCGELDIMEFMGGANGNLSSNVHWANIFSDTGHKSKALGNYTDKIKGNLTDWHIYGCEITDTQITFDVDGAVYKTLDISEMDADFGNAFKMPMYPIISLQVGQSGGTPDDDATEMNVYVDWVRCYAPVGTTVYGDIESMTIKNITTSITTGITQVADIEYTPIISNNKTVTWSSDNEAVATVKNGVITSVSDGEAIITATSKNKITTNINLTVSTTASYPVTEMSFDEAYTPVVKGNTNISNLFVKPEGYTDKIIYSSSDSDIFTVNEDTGSITPISPGTANLIATAESGVVTQKEIEIISETENPYINATFNGTTYQGDTGVGNLVRGKSAYPLDWNPREWEYSLVIILNDVDRSGAIGFVTSDISGSTSYKPCFIGTYNANSNINNIVAYGESTFETIDFNSLVTPISLKLAIVVKQGTMKFYKNGVLCGTQTIKSTNSGVKSPTTYIGCRCLATTGNAEMRMYRRALSDTEAIAITT